jgi:hypothetical protein
MLEWGPQLEKDRLLKVLQSSLQVLIFLKILLFQVDKFSLAHQQDTLEI